MTLPTSIETALITLLSEFLETKCSVYKESDLVDDISWQYYKDIHSPKMNPQGAVWITRVIPTPIVDLERLDLTFYLEFRLLVSSSSDIELRKQLFDWQSLLLSFLTEIQENGITGTVNELTINKYLIGFELTESRVTPYINQDSGGTGFVLLRYRWKLN